MDHRHFARAPFSSSPALDLSLSPILAAENTLLLVPALARTVVLQLAVIYVPFLQGVFKTVSLAEPALALSLAASSWIF